MALLHDTLTRRSLALQTAISQHVLNGDNPSVMLIDLDMISGTIQHMQQQAGYPDNTLHTFAVKANPVGKLLQHFKDRGFGAEVASLGELAQAIHMGFDHNHIVFDSPAKTVDELRYALAAGVRMNLDNFQELSRVADLLAAEPQLLQPGTYIGLRINPQVGAGSIAALSTAAPVSKFGFPLLEVRPQLVAAFQQHPWLNMLHLHVGSQGLPTARIIEGVVKVWELLEEIEAACGRVQVTALDIGGGLTVDFDSDEEPQLTRFQEQAQLLRRHVPQLFEPSCHVQLLTENGRSLVAKAGCVASRVEYTKSSGGRHIAVVHVGADLFMRACYLPETWGLRVFMCDCQGQLKGLGSSGGPTGSHARSECAGQHAAEQAPAAGSSNSSGSTDAAQQHQQKLQQEEGGGYVVVEQDVAGPLCFQGDRLAVAAALPLAEVGDYVLVADAGAYTLSMYSRYNSRPSPPVYGFTCEPHAKSTTAGSESSGSTTMRLVKLRAGDTLQQVLDFWNQI